MNTIPTYTRRARLDVDPLAAYRALTDFGRARGTLLFETADDPEAGRSGSSFLVTKPAMELEVFGDRASVRLLDTVDDRLVASLQAALESLSIVDRVDSSAAELQITLNHRDAGTSEAERLIAPSSADLLRLFASHFIPSRADVQLRAAGMFAFDFIERFEALPTVDGEGADFRFVLPTELLEIDHGSRTVTLIRFDFAGRGDYAEGRRLVLLEQLLSSLGPGGVVPTAQPCAEVTVDRSDAEFGGLVETARRSIVDGDAFQIVLSRTFETPCSAPLDAYAALRASNPSPYMFYLAGEETLFGASPETSVRVSGRPRKVEIRPLAGTRRRGANPDEDSRIEAELRLDDKEVAEHMMLVDLARNDVARVCKTGSRRVTRLLGVDRYSLVMHLVSHVEGELRDELDALHAYVSTMNMGTLTGAPKVRATQILRDLEGDRRGAYGGAVGYLTHDGEFDTAIVIRSATVRDGVARVRAGAGIVYDSDPAAEAEETRRKSAAVLDAIGGAEEVHRG